MSRTGKTAVSLERLFLTAVYAKFKSLPGLAFWRKGLVPDMTNPSKLDGHEGSTVGEICAT